jgi:hypothetical protein
LERIQNCKESVSGHDKHNSHVSFSKHDNAIWLPVNEKS